VLAARWGLSRNGRLLLAEAFDPVTELLASSLVPLVVDGSCVLVRNADRHRTAARTAQERVTVSLTDDPGQAVSRTIE